MKHARRIAAVLFLLLLAAAVTGWLYLRSDAFRESLRQRIVAEVERTTGGRATLGRFDFDWTSNRVSLRDFTLRGKEPAEAPPLLRLAQADIALSVISYVQLNARLRAVRIDGLEVNLITMPDGSTNLPGPKQPSNRNPVEQFLKLAIAQLEVHRGTLSWNFQKYPLEIKAEDLEVDLRHQTRPAIAYGGPVKAKRVSLAGFGLRDARFDLDANIGLEKDRVAIDRIRITKGRTIAWGQGALTGWQELAFSADVNLEGTAADLVPMFALPLPPQGSVNAKGRVEYRANDWRIDAEAEGQGWSVQRGPVAWNRLAWSGHVLYEKHAATVSRLRLDLPAGVFRGAGETDFRKYSVHGTVGGLQITELQRYFGAEQVPWQGFVSGPIRLEGEGANADLHAHLTVSPNDSERALEGEIEASYSTRTGIATIDRAQLATAVTQFEASGASNAQLNVKLTTSNLRDIPYADRLPLKLVEDRGRLRFEGIVTGGLANPVAEGQLQIDQARFEQQPIDHLAARVRASRGGLAFEQAVVRQGELSLSGQGSITLFDGQTRDWSAVRAELKIDGAAIPRLLKEAKLDYDAAGTAAAELAISGTLGDPKAAGPVRITGARFAKDSLGTVSATVRYASDRMEIERGQFAIDQRPVFFAGSFVPEARGARQGEFRLDIRSQGLLLERIQWWREQQLDLGARADFDLKSAGRVTADSVELASLSGFVQLPQVAYRGRSLGSLNLRAATDGEFLRVNATGNLRGASLNSTSNWRLPDRQLLGGGTFQVVNLKLADFEDFLGAPASKESSESGMFAEGSVRARGTFAGPLRDPAQLKGNMRLENLEIAPRQLMGAVKHDLTLRATGPLDVDFDQRGLNIKSAVLEAKDTRLTAAGLVALSRTGSSNVRLQGNANLAVLSALKPDLIATGDSTVDANFRGSFGQPQITGRMEFRNASFFLRNVPNGLENVNGSLFFDRTRARIESFTAQSGGGTLRLGGFVGFGDELTYQLVADGQNVRIRYPDGVSTSVNATLSLTGGASRSLLSGSLTILRTAIAPRADLGTMLAESARATASGPPRFENEFLKEMQMDVRVDTALDAELTSSLTQNVQAEVGLRIRGTPARPVVLGRVSFTQGDINFFGSRYTIDRGEVNFYNQTKIEPVINLDLQTRIRGVVVTITFAGPANKLNLSYRSDPPLQSAEILALLTVGRAPDNPTIGGGSTVQSPTFLQGASTALLGQAATAPLTGRLQRLFGVSRVRIDPQLTGIENTAQARLTIEQQVSRDIIVTFITNLNRTQQQIVSVEWDFSRDFSAVAIRDENGIFGLDFFYRKRFK